MASELVPLSGAFPSRLERRTAKDIARVRARGAVVAAREMAKVEAVADVAKTALTETADVVGFYTLLVARTPEAQVQLEHVTSAACAAIADGVLHSGRAFG